MNDALENYQAAIDSSIGSKIRKKMVNAISDFEMLTAGDKVLVATSGGKDSSALLVLLSEVKKRAAFSFEIEAALLDQRQPGFDGQAFARWVEELGIKFHLLEQDTYSIVKDKTPEGKTFCALCSRLRRGILYNFAHENGFTKIALGHHADDLLETTLLNLFYSGKLASMPPKLLSDDRRNILIRPLSYVHENAIIEFHKLLKPPVIPCNLCGSQENLKRKKMKAMISKMQLENPNIHQTFLSALSNVRPSQLLDKSIFNFGDLESSNQ